MRLRTLPASRTISLDECMGGARLVFSSYAISRELMKGTSVKNHREPSGGLAMVSGRGVRAHSRKGRGLHKLTAFERPTNAQARGANRGLQLVGVNSDASTERVQT
jgi:hypothetical protein